MMDTTEFRRRFPRGTSFLPAIFTKEKEQYVRWYAILPTEKRPIYCSAHITSVLSLSSFSNEYEANLLKEGDTTQSIINTLGLVLYKDDTAYTLAIPQNHENILTITWTRTTLKKYLLPNRTLLAFQNTWKSEDGLQRTFLVFSLTYEKKLEIHNVTEDIAKFLGNSYRAGKGMIVYGTGYNYVNDVIEALGTELWNNPKSFSAESL